MKKLCLFILLFWLAVFPASFVNAQGGVSVNVAGTPPDSSALLDVSGTNKGLLMPRMTTVQRNAIPNPATGLTIYNTDCGVYNYNSGTPANPHWATVNSSNGIIAAVTISADPVGGICSGASVTFSATPSGGVLSPNYQWQVNGNNVGTNNYIYKNSSLNNGDVVNCVLSSNEACVTGSPATSNSITMSVITIPSTPGPISGSATVCGNTGGNIYSISPVAGATSYSWSVPGDATITAGAGSDSITVTFGVSSGNVRVLASNSCGSSAASSLAVTVNPPVPATPGAISGSTSVDTGSTGHVYSINAVNYASTYTWTVPAGSAITAGQGTTSITVTFGVDSGNISVTAGNSCGTSSASSIAISVIPCAYVPGSQTFNYTGNQQSFIVPCGINSIKIECWGAQGGQGEGNGAVYGAEGGYVYGNKNVVTGQVFYIYVGGQGSLPTNANPGTGGYNGGGNGGTSSGYGGPGGGGASDVRLGGNGLANRIIVGGGGGGGADLNCGNGGIGAYPDGGICTGTCFVIGEGGTQSAGGAAGNGGSPGGFGYGGNAGAGCAGGGGSGYYGGGGGGSGCCGGPGGGGSSYYGGMDNTTGNSDGIQSGNGQVKISW